MSVHPTNTNAPAASPRKRKTDDPTLYGPTPPPLPASRDGERWRYVVGFVGYAVSDRGDFVTCRTTGRAARMTRTTFLLSWRPLASQPNREGYLHVRLCGGGKLRKVTVHRLVLEAFVGPCPPGQETRHLNGVRTDNRFPENLKWGTPKEQAADKAAHGTQVRGQQVYAAKLTDFQVALARVAYAYRLFNCRELGEMAGVDQSTVFRVISRLRWDHVADLCDTSWLDAAP